MQDETRRRLALLTLVVSALAFLGTTEGPPTARESVGGDLALGPDQPVEIAVRYVIDRNRVSVLNLIQLNFDVPLDPERFTTRIEASTGAAIHVAADKSIEIPPAECADGCTIDATAKLTWVGPVEPEIRLRWASELVVEYGDYDPPWPTPILAATTVRGGDMPTVPRLGWLAMGAALSLATALVWLRAGARFRRTRLTIALGGLPVIVSAGLFAGLNAVVAVPATIVLGLGIIIGARGLARGNGLALPVVGWLYVLFLSLGLTSAVQSAATYRPYELLGIGLLVFAPGMAAITSGSLVQGPATTIRGTGTAILVTSQGILLCVFGLGSLLFGPSVLNAPLGAVGDGSSLFGMILGAIPIALFLLLLLGIYRWSVGSRAVLLLANLLVGVATSLIISFLVLPTGTFLLGDPSWLLVPGGIVVGAAVIGAFGGLLVKPPQRVVSAAAAPVDPSAPGPWGPRARGDKRGRPAGPQLGEEDAHDAGVEEM